MKKATSKPWYKFSRKQFFVFSAIVCVLVLQSICNYYFWQSSIENDPSTVRSMVIEANSNLYRNAPRDAKTGDIYIPEARLRIPNSSGQNVLHYSYYPATPEEKRDEEIYLSGSSWDSARAKLYTANEDGRYSVSAFFKQVPNFQSCGRQFLIKFSKTGSTISTDYVLLQKLSLTDGRTAYLYTNQACDIVDNDFAPLYFAGLTSY